MNKQRCFGKKQSVFLIGAAAADAKLTRKILVMITENCNLADIENYCNEIKEKACFFLDIQTTY
ncbi:hypothetical protein [Candidatus Lokiarchaeum ossiferum]|uniref:hypothetical protein n=1 Tax=Candidatus Lokiarchaeum ossiferum TaxID=2951803 RepID=UPI00352DF2C4